MKQLDYKTIGKRIRNARLRTGMNQEQLAEKTELSIPHISHIEHGKTKLSLAAIVRICNALETTTDTLLKQDLTALDSKDPYDFDRLTEDCTVHEKKLIYEQSVQAKKLLREK